MAGKAKTEGAMQAPENIETPIEEQAVAGKAKTEGAKVYNFTSVNKYLSCYALGVQFINGKASTTNLEVAKALVKIEGVELVEE